MHAKLGIYVPVFDVLRKERPPVGAGSPTPEGSPSIGISVVDMGFFLNHAMLPFVSLLSC